jgi:hypothetical protein
LPLGVEIKYTFTSRSFLILVTPKINLGVVGAQQLLLMIEGVALLLIVIVPTPLSLLCLAAAGF